MLVRVHISEREEILSRSNFFYPVFLSLIKWVITVAAQGHIAHTQ